MGQLVRKDELYFVGDNILGKMISCTVMGLLGLNKLNSLYDGLSQYKGNQAIRTASRTVCLMLIIGKR